MSVIGTPITPADYTGRFGATPDAVRTWLSTVAADNLSNLNGTDSNVPTPDPAAYEQAIQWADNEFERRMCGLGLIIPLQVAANSLAAHTALEFTTRLAGIRLHERKPLAKLTDDTFRQILDDMRADFERWRNDPSSLPPGFGLQGGIGTDRLPAAEAIYPTVDRDGRPITPSNLRRGWYWVGNGLRFRVQ